MPIDHIDKTRSVLWIVSIDAIGHADVGRVHQERRGPADERQVLRRGVEVVATIGAGGDLRPAPTRGQNIGARTGGGRVGVCAGNHEIERTARIVPTSDELGVGETLVNDHPSHRVGERDVAADIEAQPDVSPLRGAGSPRIDRHESGAIAHTTQEVMEEDGMRLASVGAPEDHHVGLLNLAIGRGSSSGSEHCRQTGDAWSVSSPITAVDVVAAHHHAGELLCHEVHLIGGLGTAEHPKPVGPKSPSFRKPGSGSIESLIPRRRP